MKRLLIYTGSFLALLTALLYAFEKEFPKTMSTSDKTPKAPPERVEKTNEEWKKILTPAQYYVAREAGTEFSHGDIYKDFKKQGAGKYYCVCCKAELFSSDVKFDSGCGWPSFFDASNKKNVLLKPDPDGSRTEVVCGVCDAHLGHVFIGEGFDTPTNKRFCINGTVLHFVPIKKED